MFTDSMWVHGDARPERDRRMAVPGESTFGMEAMLKPSDGTAWTSRFDAMGLTHDPAARRRTTRLSQCRVDQGIGHPKGSALDLAVRKSPDVLQHDVGLDAVDD
jgi:hypothetical protein